LHLLKKDLTGCASQTVAAPVWAYFSVDSNGNRCHSGGSLMAQSSGRVKKFHVGTRRRAESYKVVYNQKNKFDI